MICQMRRKIIELAKVIIQFDRRHVQDRLYMLYTLMTCISFKIIVKH